MYKQFYTKSPQERRQILESSGAQNLNDLASFVGDETATLDRMSENVIGAWRLPLGVVPQLLINGKMHRVAMSTEEPSVVAAVNRTSRLFNACGGITCKIDTPVTMAQIVGCTRREKAQDLARLLIAEKTRWLTIANAQDAKLVELGGGAFDLCVELLDPSQVDSPLSSECAENTQENTHNTDEVFCVLKLYVHSLDAMGANAVNTMAEAILHTIAQDFKQFAPLMAILSNSGVGRMVHAHCCLTADALVPFVKMDEVQFIERIARASLFADLSSERAVTHNKGVMNGIIAAALPLGQDTRAISAACYDAACKCGRHCPMVRWAKQKNALHGTMSLPLPVGLAGGFRKIAAVDAAFRFDKIDNYQELCSILASVGMAQNFAALWALVTEGIQAGHMKLHARKNP